MSSPTANSWLAWSGERGRVVIGALPTVASGLLPTIIAAFTSIHPQVELLISDNNSTTPLQQLRTREIDFAITSRAACDDIDFIPVLEDPIMLVVLMGSALDVAGPADWSIFADHPFIGMAPRSSVRDVTDMVIATADVAVKPLYECKLLPTACALVEAGLGITALPQSTLDLRRWRIAARPLENSVVKESLGLARLVGRSLSPSAVALHQHVLDGIAALEREQRRLQQCSCRKHAIARLLHYRGIAHGNQAERPTGPMPSLRTVSAPRTYPPARPDAAPAR